MENKTSRLNHLHPLRTRSDVHGICKQSHHVLMGTAEILVSLCGFSGTQRSADLWNRTSMRSPEENLKRFILETCSYWMERDGVLFSFNAGFFVQTQLVQVEHSDMNHQNDEINSFQNKLKMTLKIWLIPMKISKIRYEQRWSEIIIVITRNNSHWPLLYLPPLGIWLWRPSTFAPFVSHSSYADPCQVRSLPASLPLQTFVLFVVHTYAYQIKSNLIFQGHNRRY